MKLAVMAKNKIFNKSSLEKLSSPDQLDKLVKITPLPLWAFIASGVLIVIVALIWSITGSISVTENATGVYLPQSKSYAMTSAQAGIIEKVYVENGDMIEEGDAIFSIDMESAKRSLSDLQERKTILESITMNSTDDVTNEDTADLISIKIQMNNSGVEVKQASSAVDIYEKKLTKVENKLSSAETTMSQKQENYDKVYEKYTKGEATQADVTKAQRALTEAQNNYSTLFSEKKTLEQQITSAKAQKNSASIGESGQKKSLAQQFEATKDGKLTAINKAIEDQEQVIKDGKIRTTIGGRVINLNVAPGSAIGQGAEYMTVRDADDEGDNIIQCYIPVQTGKSVKPGMKVVVYPTNVNRQEYGHMEATVLSVDDYVATQLELKQALGSDILANAFMQQGAFIGIKCELKKDESTASGYYWSSRKGAELTLTEGTLVSADVVVEENHPISMLIPYLKQQADEFVKPQDNSSDSTRSETDYESEEVR